MFPNTTTTDARLWGPHIQPTPRQPTSCLRHTHACICLLGNRRLVWVSIHPPAQPRFVSCVGMHGKFHTGSESCRKPEERAWRKLAGNISPGVPIQCAKLQGTPIMQKEALKGVSGRLSHNGSFGPGATVCHIWDTKTASPGPPPPPPPPGGGEGGGGVREAEGQ